MSLMSKCAARLKPVLKLRLAAVGLLSLVVQTGCMHARYYPLCVYGQRPDLRSEDELRAQMKAFVALAAGDGAELAVGPNNRVVIIRTTGKKHLKLRQGWPKLACIGPTTYQEEYGD